MSIPVDRLAGLLVLTAGERTALQDLKDILTRASESAPIYAVEQIPAAGDLMSLLRKLEQSGLIDVIAQFPRTQWNFSVVKRLLVYLSSQGAR